MIHINLSKPFPLGKIPFKQVFVIVSIVCLIAIAIFALINFFNSKRSVPYADYGFNFDMLNRQQLNALENFYRCPQNIEPAIDPDLDSYFEKQENFI
jgi:ABC-type uncharacterized transport system permease subunit